MPRSRLCAAARHRNGATGGWGKRKNHFMAETTLVWLRSDLRVADNPALGAAMRDSRSVVAVHIEATDASLRRRGGASRWWLHHSLGSLAKDLARLGVTLETLSDDTEATLFEAIAKHGASRVVWNRRYGPAEREIDGAI